MKMRASIKILRFLMIYSTMKTGGLSKRMVGEEALVCRRFMTWTSPPGGGDRPTGRVEKRSNH